MTEHIPESDLLLAFDGELPRDREEAVREHMRFCILCEEKWTGIDRLSTQMAAFSHTPQLQPQDEAVASLLSEIDLLHSQCGATRDRHPVSRYLMFANALGAVAAAVVCVLMWPSLHGQSQNHPPASQSVVYDFEQSVPAGYVSLPFADPALPLDDAAVLPVELSAEDLEMMGLDPGETLGSVPRSPVKAEILIGMDGWPRAIKLIEQ